MAKAIGFATAATGGRSMEDIIAQKKKRSQQRAERAQQKESQRLALQQEALGAYEQVMNPGLSQQQITQGIQRTELRQAQQLEEAAKKQYEDYKKSDQRQEDWRKAIDDAVAGLNWGSGNLDLQLEQLPEKTIPDAEKGHHAAASYFEQNRKATEDRHMMETDVADVETMGTEERQLLNDYVLGRNDWLNPQNVAKATAARADLAEKYGADRVEELAESWQRYQNALLAEKNREQTQEGAGSGFGAKVGHSAASVAANALGTITAPLGYFQEALGRTGRYQTLDPNNAGAMPGQYASTVREKVAEDIRGEGGLGRNLLSLGYQGGMSAADNLVRIAMGGGTKFGTLGLAAAGSFGSTLSEASARGATPGEAVLLGVANAGIEMATEKVPLDELFKAGKGGFQGARQAFKAALKQGGIEAAEEELSFLGNLTMDALVMREKSAYNQQIGDLVANGMSYADAKAQADRGLWDEAVNTAVTSFVSGGVMSGAQSGGQYLAQRQQDNARYKAELGGQIQAMMEQEQAAAKTPEQEWGAALTRGIETPKTEAQPLSADQVRTRDAIDEMTGADQAQVRGVQVPIQKDMPEQARYDALKDKKVVAVMDADSASYPQEMSSLAALKAKAKGQAEKIIKPLAKKLGILNRNMSTPDLEVEFRFSNNNLGESIHKQLNYGGSYSDFAKTMVNLDKVLANAILVETHGDKYAGTVRESKYLENVYVLLGAFKDGDTVIPVQMEIKKTSDTGSHLYMTVAMTKIEADVKGNTIGDSPSRSLLSASEYNIADIFGKINPQDAHFLKYLPDNFLTEEQAAAKQGALAEDAAKIRRYKETGQRSENGARNVPQGAGEDFEAMGAADYNFSPYTRMQNEYGNIPEGENPVRSDDAPISTDGTDRVSYTARTAIGAQVTPDEFVPLIENEVVRGGFSFIPITNDQTVQNAVHTIQAEGWQTARANWTAAVRQGRAGADITAQGALFYNHAVNSGNYQEAMDILLDYSQAVRNSARGLQAARILKRLTPENRLYMIRRSIQRMVEDMHLQQEIAIDENLARRYQETRDNDEADRILDEIARDVARQIPPTLGERITALRYLNMLGNFRTQVRNWSGNVGAKFTYLAKDEIAATIEALASAVSGGRFQRTKVHWVDRATRRAARADFENVADWISGGGRANDRQSESDAFAQQVQENRRILPVGFEQYRRATDWAMNNGYFGDAAFGREAYARALAGYLNARGIRTDNLEAIDRDTLNQAREYAVRQAQEATFRDNNQVSDFVSRALRGRNTPAWARVIGEAIMPFRKTPANVLVRAEEFSPLGLINSAAATYQAARGNISGAELVESWAKTMTGTGLFAIGWALANMGYLRGGPDQDEEKAEFDKLNGLQDYAIVLPDGTNLTIDFLSPAAMPMFLGAQMDSIMQEGDLTWADLEGVFSALADPMIEMSMLSGVNDTIDAIRYADNSMGQFLVNAATNYLTQALGNTLLGQMERSTEESRMTTYVDKDSGVPAWLQRNLGKLSQKIPGWDYQQTAYIDQWGEEQKNPEGIKNWLYQLLSPAYVDKANVDAVAEELYRLNEVQSDVNVFPQSPENSLTYTDKDGNRHEKYNLTAQELDKLKRTEGQTQARLAAELIKSADYAAMTDSQKAEAISLAYDYAREIARIEAIEDYGGFSDSWMEGIQGKETAAILQKVAAAEFTGAFSSITESWREGYDDTGAREALEEAFTVFDGLSAETKKAIMADSSGRLGYYLTAREKGVDTETFIDLYRQYWDIDQSGKTAGEKAQAWSYALEKAAEGRMITEKQKDALKAEMGYLQMFRADTEKFDQLTESGLSVDDAQDLGWLIQGLKPQAGYSSVRAVQKAEAITGSSLSEADKIAALKIYGTDAQDENLDLMLEAGYSAADYVAAWQIYAREDEIGGRGTKNRTIEAFMEQFNVDRATAAAIYDIYG